LHLKQAKHIFLFGKTNKTPKPRKGEAMYYKIDDFKKAWIFESSCTRKIMNALTDKSLEQKVVNDHRTLGRIAWHITQAIPEMAGRTGLKFAGPEQCEPVPSSAEAIQKAYDSAATSLLEQVIDKWQDETLLIEDDMYGEMWKRGATLLALIGHEIHHRGQMTVLMRQAGLVVPGVYGPAKEEWTKYGMNPPEI
jgi:uncharacterized damage-inducible protein DinB